MTTIDPSFPFPRIDPRYCCYRLRIKRSKIHRWGVYAAQNIPARHKVIEYTGERINRREAKRRNDTYFFSLDNYWTLDGAVGGSGAEFINHSCQPNLETRIVKGHVLYMSLRRIRKGEELTLDYNYDWDPKDLKPCACGAAKCRGVINAK